MPKPMIPAIAAMLVLAGCDYLGGGNAVGGNQASALAQTNQTSATGGKPDGTSPQISDAGVTRSRSLQPAGGKPVDGGSGGIDAQMLIGRWGDNGDCTQDVVFAPDGTFRSFNGSEGQWTLSGNRLTLIGANGTFPMQLQSGGPDRLIITNPDGSIGTSQRC